MRRKITIFMAITSCIILLIAVILAERFNESVSAKNTLEKNNAITDAMALNIDKYITELINTANTLASSPIIREALIERNNELESLSIEARSNLISELNIKWKEISSEDDPFILSYTTNNVAEYFKYQQEIIPEHYGEIFLTNKYGEAVASTSKLSGLAHHEKYWWIASYNDGKGMVFLDDRGFDDSVGGYVLGVVVPVYDNSSNVIGILKCNINILSLFEDIDHEYVDIYKPSKVQIARSNGLIIYEDDQVPLSNTLDISVLSYVSDFKEAETKVNFIDNELLVCFSSIQNTLKSSENGFGGSDKSEDHSLGNTGESWMVVLTTSKQIISNKTLKHTIQIILIGFILILAEMFMIYFFAKRITKPIEELAQVSKNINQGNLDVPIKIQSNDEIGELVVSFKNMIQRIKSTMASRDELVQEIEKRKQLESTKLEMEEQLRIKQKFESIGELASGVAHEINNPLNGILNYSQIITDICVEEGEDLMQKVSISKYSSEIVKETNRISIIVKTLLNFSRNDKEEFLTYNMNDIVSNTLSLVKSILQKDRIELEVIISERIPDIECRSNQIQQVIMNLITNGRDSLNSKYPSYNEHKKITITIENIKYKDGEGIRLSIRDNGCGISKEIQDKIFDPFFTTKSRAKGTGLGLSICYNIIKEHNGQLSFETKEGQYTIFNIDLPLYHNDVNPE